MSNEFYIGAGRTATWPDLPAGIPIMALHYRNTMLLQKKTNIGSKTEVNLGVPFGPYDLTAPIITAPMDTITDEKMIRTIAGEGGIGTLPRAHGGDALTYNLRVTRRLADEGIPFVASIGLNNAVEEAQMYVDQGAQMILIDVAHGGMERVTDAAQDIKRTLQVAENVKVQARAPWVIAGSISNYTIAEQYRDAGVDIGRVGVGNGQMCTTRVQTATGTPQLSALLDSSAAGLALIADGGIKQGSDVALALAVPNVHLVMIGSMFGGTSEAPGEVIEIEGGRKMKRIRGQASKSYMEDHGLYEAGRSSVEGVERLVEFRGSVIPIVGEILSNLRSAHSYSNARTQAQFQENAVFQYVGEGVYANENRPID